MESALGTLLLIRSTHEKISLLKEGLKNVNGPLRNSYVEVLKDELYRLVREIDQYKRQVCEDISDIDTNAILNISMYPNNA